MSKLIICLFIQRIFVAADSFDCPKNCQCDGESQESLKCKDFHPEEVEKFLTLKKDLHNLTLTYSTITTKLWSLICNRSTLKILDLSSNKVQYFPDGCFKNMTKLENLRAEFNKFQSLDDGMFVGLNSLVSLSMRDNEMSTIGKKVFTDFGLLTKLGYIDLGYNKLTALDSWPLALSAKRFVAVKLEGNFISVLSNSYNLSSDCLKLLNVSIDLSMNKFTYYSEIFKKWGPKSGKQLLCPNGIFKKIFLDKNPFAFDCIDYVPFSLLTLYRPRFLIGLPESIHDLRELRFQDLQCSVSKDCPYNCTCFQRPFTNTILVDCSKIKLKSLPAAPPLRKPMTHFYTTPLRYDLIFRQNALKSLTRNFTFLKHSTSIDFSHGDISTVDLDAWRLMAKAHRVFLHNNSLTTLPTEILTIKFHWDELSLHDNKWSCSCENAWMKGWVSLFQNKLSRNLSCFSPQWHANQDFMNVDFCYEPLLDYKFGLKVMGPLVFSLVCMAAIVFWLRRRCSEMKLKPLDMRYTSINSTDDTLDENLKCDVFLSCSEDDIEFGEMVLEKLEFDRGLAVMHSAKEFSLGILALEGNIIGAIGDCKQSICMVSRQFLHSSRCMEELRISIDLGGNRPVVLLLLEPLDLDCLGLSESHYRVLIYHAYNSSIEDILKILFPQ